MVFAVDKNQLRIELPDRKWDKVADNRVNKRMDRRQRQQEKQCAQVSELCKQRLLGYAESFHELAKSFNGEFSTDTEDRQIYLEEWKLWENRQVIGKNLQEVAHIMTQVAMEELWYQPMEDKRRKLLLQVLKSEGIVADNICYLPNEKGRRTIGMSLITDRRDGVPATEVADMLSALLKKTFQPSVATPYLVDKTRRSFVFVEEAKFIALTGFCKAVKEGETISGDNYSIVESEKGKLTLLLSDGTGSGELASANSEKVLDLMEKMLEAGFTMETAINMVNAAVFAGIGDNNHPTLDVCSLDLYQGTCDITKVGGAATFLKRQGKIEEISMGNLPLGIFQSIRAQTLHHQLQDGDYLILMTDGVLDALECENREALMAESIRGLTECNPQEIAEKLMQLVLCHCGGRIHDDMTILVVGMWES